MQYISCETSGWVKHKLESRLPGEISVTSGIKVLLFSRSVMSNSLQPHGWQHIRLPCPPPSPRACSNSWPLNQRCSLTISSTAPSAFFCLQSFLAWGAFPMSQFSVLGGQAIRVSATLLSMNIQSWFPLGWTGSTSLLSKGVSRLFSSTTIQKH